MQLLDDLIFGIVWTAIMERRIHMSWFPSTYKIVDHRTMEAAVPLLRAWKTERENNASQR
jgi:hypothetical protein